LGNTIKGREKMSKDEEIYFWPAIQEAHAFCPSVADRATWNEGREQVEWKLKSNRPE